MIERAGLALLHRLDPERGHGLALGALRLGLVQGADLRARPMLAQRVAGLSLPNPLGLAAGFDKNAVALSGLARQGFGFLEVGAATPRPQPGNPQPRLFRLSRDHAVINRFGFNNDGADAIAARLAQRPAGVIVGLNIGANKDSADRAADFAQVLRRCGAHVDFATVNVSSPNTEKLRALQGPAALRGLLAGVMEARAELARPCPIFLKIAPDLNADEISELAGVATEAGIDAVIATNTTLSRDGLTDPQAAQAGGLSGRPLFERSTRVLALLSQATGGQMPLIGVGGVESAETAYAKIKAGACAVQLYSALVYQGFSLTGRILDGLEAQLRNDGYTSLSQAIGAGRGDWL